MSHRRVPDDPVASRQAQEGRLRWLSSVEGVATGTPHPAARDRIRLFTYFRIQSSDVRSRTWRRQPLFHAPRVLTGSTACVADQPGRASIRQAISENKNMKARLGASRLAWGRSAR
jgi:hypothetical protein